MGEITRPILATALALSLTISSAYQATPRQVAWAAPPQQAAPPTFGPGVEEALAAAGPGGSVRVIVRMKSATGKYDLPEPPLEAVSDASRSALVTSLQATAAASQQDLLNYLGQPAIDAQTDDVRAYWIFNGIALRGTPDAIASIALRGDVESVRLDLPIALDAARAQAGDQSAGSITETLRARLGAEVPDLQAQPAMSFTRWPRVAALAAQPPSAGQVAWGIDRIRADRVWSALGVTGQGVVVANVDSGVDWQHPALLANYRGYGGGPVADHLHNWYDATDEGATYPSDIDGHGTHTMGTIVGQNGVGVAPGARWMAVKAFNRSGLALSSWLHSAYQFILAPGGDPSYAPDVVNNSWSNPNASNEEFKEDLTTLRAAGILAVFSTGNRGPQPRTVGSPASLPEAIGIGATDPDDDVAPFSGRGPTPFDGIQPTLSAPGVNVVSTFPGGGYQSLNGTSMAAPHVAGAAALVMSAAPTLGLKPTLYALTSTVKALSPIVPNNDSGWGRLDAFDAVLSVFTAGVIAGVVRDGGQPVPGADVVAVDPGKGFRVWTKSNAQGAYALQAAPGIYSVQAGAFGYYTATSNARVVVAGNITPLDLDLVYQPAGSVRGVVRDATSGAYVTATVRALNTPKVSTSNNNCIPCRYALDLPTGSYTLEVRALGYQVQTRAVQITDGNLLDEDFSLTPAQRIALVDSGAFYYGSAAPLYREALDELRLSYDLFSIKQPPADTPTITQLLTYDTVIWSAPFDAPSIVGASDVLSRYLAAGNNLLLTGNNIALYDGGGLLTYQSYMARLNATYVDQNFDAEQVAGAVDGPIAGQVLTISRAGASIVSPDVVQQLRSDGGPILGTYTNLLNGEAGAGTWVAQCSRHRAAYYAFGLESISPPQDRIDVLRRTLDAFVAPRPALGIEVQPRDTHFTGVGINQPGTTVTHVLRLRNTGDGGITQTFDLQTLGNQWPTRLSETSIALSPCASALVTVTVDVPAGVGWNASDSANVRANIRSAPNFESSLTFTSKTPAGILLVDDDRFFDRERDFLNALGAQGNVADHWDTRDGDGSAASPPLDVLRRYPVVVWFNGYDWFDPITPEEERTLIAYLEGGGRLFFTSQAALAYTAVSPFVRSYLGVSGIDFTDSTSNVVGMPGTALGEGSFGGSLLPFPYNWNLSSAIQPTPGSAVVLRGDSSQPFGVIRSGPALTPGQPEWRTAFAPFAVEALPADAQADLINRIVGWLSPLGRSMVTADRSSARPGEVVNYTAVLRADDVISPALSAAHPITLEVDVGPGLTVVASSLPGAGGSSAGRWQGEVRAGDVLTWTFSAQVGGGLPAGTALVANARFGLNDAGVRHSRAAVVRLDAPALHATLSAAQAPADWRSAITVTLRVTNTAPIDAPEVVLQAVVPPSMTLSSATAQAAGVDATRLVFTTSIPARGSVEFSYRVTLPAFSDLALPSYEHAVLVNDRSGVLTTAGVWITPTTYVVHYPLLPK